jgi:hypothetical protein
VLAVIVCLRFSDRTSPVTRARGPGEARQRELSS